MDMNMNLKSKGLFYITTSILDQHKLRVSGWVGGRMDEWDYFFSYHFSVTISERVNEFPSINLSGHVRVDQWTENRIFNKMTRRH